MMRAGNPSTQGRRQENASAESVFKKTNQKPAKIKIKENKGHKSPKLACVDRRHNWTAQGAIKQPTGRYTL